MARLRLTLALACTIAATAALAGCSIGGDDEQIPRDAADRMIVTLGELEGSSTCAGARENIEQLRTQAEAASVGGTVGDQLNELVSQTEQLVEADKCTATGASGAEGVTDGPDPDKNTTTSTTSTSTTTTDEPPPPSSDETETDGGGSDEEASGEEAAPEPGGGNPPAGPEGNPNEPDSGGIGTGGTGAGDGDE